MIRVQDIEADRLFFYIIIMKAYVLIIEDEPEIANLIRLYLEKEGISVFHTISGEEGLQIIDQGKVDLIVLDINLPGMDGFEFLKTLRKKHEIPVVILSARQDDSDMIMGFGIGADDYVTKPFSPRVLSARIRTRLTRAYRQGDSEENLLHFGNWTLDRENLWLKKENERVNLPPKELSLLLTLAESAGKPFTQQELYQKIWGNAYGDLTTVSVHIQRLRKKLENDPANPEYIMTAYGQGYYLETGK